MSYARLPESAVLARANGQELTKGEVERELALRVRLAKHHKPSLSPTEEKNLAVNFRKGALRKFVRESLLAEAAAAAGVTNETATVEKFRTTAFRNFRGRKDKSFDDLKKLKGVDAGRLEAQVAREALAVTMERKWVAEEPLELAADYTDKFLENLRHVNELAAATNALQFAKATNAWNRIKAGEDFMKVGRETTELAEERDEDLEWGDYDEEAFEEVPELLAALKAIKPGDCTPPLESDNGVAIVRLDAVDPEDGEMSLSRIYFHLALVYEIPSNEEIVALANREHAEKVVAARRAALWKAAKIEFPFKKIDFTPLKEEEEE